MSGVLKEAELDLRILERAAPDLPGLQDARRMLESAAEEGEKGRE